MNGLASFLQPSDRLLVISACTAKKKCGLLGKEALLSATDLDLSSRRKDGEKRLAKYRLPVAEIYSGTGHKFVREAVLLLRKCGFSLAHFILSAGYGLLNENDRVVPYNVTFAGASKSWIQERGRQLELRKRLTEVAGSFDRTILILGREYFEAIGLPLQTEILPYTLAYIAPSLVNRIGEGIVIISIGQVERREIGAYSSSAKEKRFLTDVRCMLQTGGNDE